MILNKLTIIILYYTLDVYICFGFSEMDTLQMLGEDLNNSLASSSPQVGFFILYTL